MIRYAATGLSTNMNAHTPMKPAIPETVTSDREENRRPARLLRYLPTMIAIQRRESPDAARTVPRPMIRCR